LSKIAETTNQNALIEEILGDARKKAGRVLRKAEQDAKQIEEKAQKEAAETRRSTIDAASARAAKEKVIVLNTIDLEVKRIEIETKESVISEAFRSAEKRLLERKTYDYPAVLAELIASAAKAIGGSSFRIALGKDDHSTDISALQKRVSQKLSAQIELKLDPTPAPIRGGTVVVSSDGRRMIDNSFSAREARLHEPLRRRIAAILFEGITEQGQHT